LQGLDTIASEDWLALRSRTFVFSDYLDQWSGRLSNLPPTMARPAASLYMHPLEAILFFTFKENLLLTRRKRTWCEPC